MSKSARSGESNVSHTNISRSHASSLEEYLYLGPLKAPSSNLPYMEPRDPAETLPVLQRDRVLAILPQWHQRLSEG